MQFVINNWYLFLALAVVVALLAAGPLTRLVYGIKTIPVAQAIRVVNHESGVIVDVRESDEFRSGHIPDAINMPLSSLAGNIKQIDKYRARPIVVCCRTSQRSARAAVALRKHDFSTVHVLAGGMTAWQNENLPTER